MATNRSKQAAVRKSVYVFGGVAVGVALLGFVLMSVVGGGGAGDTPFPSSPPSAMTPPAPSAPSAPTGAAAQQGLRPGGRDPFEALVAASAPQAPSTPEPKAEELNGAPITTLKYMMLYKVVFNGQAAYMQYDDSGARQLVAVGDKTFNGYVVQTIGADCADFLKDGKTVHLCTGQQIPLS
jgi:hypothetical protein